MRITLTKWEVFEYYREKLDLKDVKLNPYSGNGGAIANTPNYNMQYIAEGRIFDIWRFKNNNTYTYCSFDKNTYTWTIEETEYSALNMISRDDETIPKINKRIEKEIEYIQNNKHKYDDFFDDVLYSTYFFNKVMIARPTKWASIKDSFNTPSFNPLKLRYSSWAKIFSIGKYCILINRDRY